MAAPLGMTVHLEFMRFRAGVQTLEDAVDVVVQADRPNGFIVLDVLHLMRAGGSVASLARTPRDRIAVVQLCDGPLPSPPPDKLADEARTDRRIPGEGEFPIAELLRCLDPGVSLSVEIPLAGPRAAWPAVERMTLLANGTRRHLAGFWPVPA
jgi:sugar phosphate isomerase/epimerase